MDPSPLARIFALKHIGAYAAIVVVGGVLGGYAIHEHNAAQNLATQNQLTTARLTQTQQQLTDLTSKVNTLVARAEAPPAPAAQPATVAAAPARPATSVQHREDPRYKKLQAQLDAQGKAIQEARDDLAVTQGDLTLTRSDLSGSIAHTHDELVALQKRGERNYSEFDISKSKQFTHTGPFGVRLKKANEKHQYADLELIVDDRNVSQKHVNLYQPVMFYTPDSPQAAEVVINNISKDHIHGYISAPKYRKSELAAMSNADASATPGSDQGQNSSPQPAAREKLPTPTPQ